MKLDKETKSELVQAARVALLRPDEHTFWNDVERNMVKWDEARKDLVEPRPNRSIT